MLDITSLGGASGKEPTYQFRRQERWVGRSPGGGNGHSSSLLAWRTPWTEEPAWWATAHGVAKSQTGLKHLSTHARYSPSASLSYSREPVIFDCLSWDSSSSWGPGHWCLLSVLTLPLGTTVPPSVETQSRGGEGLNP